MNGFVFASTLKDMLRFNRIWLFDRDNAWRDGGGSGIFVRTLVEVARSY